MSKVFFQDIQQGISSLDASTAHTASGENRPKVEEIFAPEQHAGALDPNVTIVLGARGAGKSFWAGVLGDNLTRRQQQTPILISASTRSSCASGSLVQPSENEGLILAQTVRGLSPMVHRKGLAMVSLK
jgi:hypothetical protein